MSRKLGKMPFSSQKGNKMRFSNQTESVTQNQKNQPWVAPVVEAIAVWENTLAANNSTADGPLCTGSMGPATSCIDPIS